ncbi:ABC transporter permease [Mesorhizobium sp.]|uniref:ABC transporter permease n=1 Tax=Mesorhizobium sp. TaxID=1871066 RepID=UPI00122035E5|nr:ABC transporter permease [Mesorhizobium sp.]TIL38122.1 MAG: ABC transporter permease [Mesorhizobium sp.]
MRIGLKRHIDSLLAIYVALVFLGATIFLALPLIITLLMAFDSRTFLGPFPPPGFSFQWFGRLWQNDYLWKGFYTSLEIAFTATAAATGVGAFAALALSRMTNRGRDLVASIFLSPIVMPGVIIGFAMLMFFSAFQVLSPFERLVAGHLIIAIPYTIRLTLIGLMGISDNLREAALSLGANDRQAFFTVTLPLAKNSIAAGSIFAFAFSMDDLAISLFLSDFNTYTLPVALVGLMRASFDLTIAAAAVVLVGLTLVLLFVLDRVIGLERAIGQGIYKA